MCPISFPICLPYWVWVVLMFCGLTSFKALVAVSLIFLAIISFAVYKVYKRGNTLMKSVRMVLGSVVHAVGSALCMLGCAVKAVAKVVSGDKKDDAAPAA